MLEGEEMISYLTLHKYIRAPLLITHFLANGRQKNRILRYLSTTTQAHRKLRNGKSGGQEGRAGGERDEFLKNLLFNALY